MAKQKACKWRFFRESFETDKKGYSKRSHKITEKTAFKHLGPAAMEWLKDESCFQKRSIRLDFWKPGRKGKSLYLKKSDKYYIRIEPCVRGKWIKK